MLWSESQRSSSVSCHLLYAVRPELCQWVCKVTDARQGQSTRYVLALPKMSAAAHVANAVTATTWNLMLAFFSAVRVVDGGWWVVVWCRCEVTKVCLRAIEESC